MHGPTIGVLSAWFGGPYFGGLLGGIAANLAETNGRMIAVQTLDAGTFAEDFLEPPPFSHQVAWDHISGYIVFLNAANVPYLEAARRNGRPVVVISDSPEGFDCPTVYPDNFTGARAATKHLINHGHQRIAFVGYAGQNDSHERYEAYRETLLKHGQEPDPGLFFDVDDMQESGGVQAARAMLARGMPSTAVLTGNDRMALGLIRTLTAAGLTVPGDQAVIGFDDIEAAVNLSPSLTTVRQPLEEIGSLAARLLTQMIEGRQIPDGAYRVATSLVVRESCGCTDALLPAGPDTLDVDRLQGPGDLLAGLRRILGSRPPRGRDPGRVPDLDGCAQGIAEVLRTAVDGRPGPDGLRLRRMLSPLSVLLSSNEALVEVTGLIRQYGQNMQARSGLDRDVDVTRRVEYCLHRIFAHLSQAQVSSLADHRTSMMTSLAAQNSISMELLRSQERDPRSLLWLRLTEVRGGCLGLWVPPREGHPDQSALTLRIFDREIGGLEESPAEVRIESFPPADVVRMADVTVGDMIYVAHLKVGAGDWGMLALVAPIQAYLQEGRETLNQWAALLSVALEHEAVLKTMREQEEHLRQAALYDELTGLPNRALFRTALTAAMARAQRRPDFGYAVLMLDLDGFKLINDTLGHQAGDQLLQQVAIRLKECLRTVDTPARFGGDEFAVLLEEIPDVDSVTIVAQRLQGVISAPHHLRDAEVVVSASIGIAMADPSYHDTETIMRDADAAMYVAKAGGKRAHAVFDPTMHANVVDRLRIEGELRNALKYDELVLLYQPIVDLRTGVISGAEALIRWQHPSRGLLTPDAFLPVAEESGLILPISDWVLGEACRQLMDWGFGSGPGSPDFMMSINVSNHQFWHSPLVDDVDLRLRSMGLDPRCLAVEITEGVIMHDVKLASSTLGGLKTLGVQVHVDDFGTGYSSLEALHDLSIDALKIDRSFVSRLTTSPRSKELVRTIVTMGRNLGLDVIAEGIESAVDLDIVRTLGCTHGQGYLYSRPVPAAQLLAQLAAGPPAPAR